MDELLLKLKEIRANILFTGLMYIIIGIIFIIFPKEVVGAMSALMGALLVLVGFIQFVGKVFDDQNRASGMLVGALIAIIGVWIILNPEFTASILPIVIGVMLIVAAIQKLSMAFNAKQYKMSKWWIFIIFAVVDFLIGALCVVRAFQVVTFGMMMVGIMMIYVGVTSIFVASRINKQQRVVDVRIVSEEDIE